MRQTGTVVRLAASHSASEAFVAALLTRLDASEKLAVELVTANSQVVRALVAEGRADVGVAASRPDPTPNPGVREAELVEDAIVCGVPPGHPWAARAQVTRKRFLATADGGARPVVQRALDRGRRAHRARREGRRAADGGGDAARGHRGSARPPRARAAEPPCPGPERLHDRRGRRPRLPAQLRARHPGLRRGRLSRCASSSSASASTSGSGCAEQRPDLAGDL